MRQILQGKMHNSSHLNSTQLILNMFRSRQLDRKPTNSVVEQLKDWLNYVWLTTQVPVELNWVVLRCETRFRLLVSERKEIPLVNVSSADKNILPFPASAN
jgi:hypothetical protein